ncbi:hypothetical protein [Bacillus rhizoplanae]|uniref:hypothetical protein n=1 Tax=Bacillus rhizoplanae TaxID=2880966 RepID=UPI003D207F6F
MRTQPLNIEEKASADVKTMDINEEMRIKRGNAVTHRPSHPLLSLYSFILSRQRNAVSISCAAMTDKANSTENNFM